MLRFEEDQEAAVKNQRRAFNAQQVAMAETHRLNAEGANLMGNASPIPRDVWGEWDNDGLMVQRSMLAVFNDLAASVARPFPIGKLISYFQQISDSGEVNVSLDGRSTARTDQQTYAYVGTPVPIVNSTFSYGWRQVAAAQSEGMQLDDAGRLNANRVGGRLGHPRGRQDGTGFHRRAYRIRHQRGSSRSLRAGNLSSKWRS
jgi:hypothetical protein